MGYIGKRKAATIIVDGLKKLEYRGYDSYGVSTIGAMGLEIDKHQGRISDSAYETLALNGTTGIGHTRWATHGVPNDQNAHPHTDCSNRIAIVHNGIIENYTDLKRQLLERGHIFRSDTDTEVIVHRIEEECANGQDILWAVQTVIGELVGTYALLVIIAGENRIIAARHASPLVIGIGDGEYFAASDIMPMIDYTKRVVYLEDGDIADLTLKNYRIYNAGKNIRRPVETIDWSQESPKQGEFPHFMLKEIYEQPQVYHNTLASITSKNIPDVIKECKSVTIIACGSSYHAGLIFKYLFEDACAIPVRCEYASEFKYFPPPIEGVVIGISQSGETADTIYAMKQAKMHNCTTVAITNVRGSSISRSADYTILMSAEPEVSVAATKSVIAELAVLMQIINVVTGGDLTGYLQEGYQVLEETLLTDITPSVELCQNATSIIYVSRGAFYPVILEGALKMKEISYIHAEGFPSGELKHGSFALLSPETPVIIICMPGETYGVLVSNIKEIKARGSPVICIGEDGDTVVSELSDIFIPIRQTNLYIQVLSGLVVLQLLAYYMAVRLNRDVDRPRNLAKSVTVE